MHCFTRNTSAKFPYLEKSTIILQTSAITFQIAFRNGAFHLLITCHKIIINSKGDTFYQIDDDDKIFSKVVREIF